MPLGAARIGRRKNVHPYVVSHVRREGLRREIENDEHANGDVGYLIRTGLPQVCREASPTRILFLSLQFDDKPKALECEHEVDSTTTYVLGLECVPTICSTTSSGRCARLDVTAWRFALVPASALS